MKLIIRSTFPHYKYKTDSTLQNKKWKKPRQLSDYHKIKKINGNM